MGWRLLRAEPAAVEVGAGGESEAAWSRWWNAAASNVANADQAQVRATLVELEDHESGEAPMN
jgi:hypothetical protein